jgi:enoyl-CoA hydratase/carnithine racemase
MISQEKLLVAAIHGYALGAGIELPMCCDLRIASEDARIGLPEVSLGYIPSAGGTQMLSRHVPPGIATQMIMTGDSIDAQTAFRYGLVQRVVTPERLYGEAEALTRKIIMRPQHLVALACRAVREGAELSLGQAIALESRLAERAILAR